jgi:hypothetical protein
MEFLSKRVEGLERKIKGDLLNGSCVEEMTLLHPPLSKQNVRLKETNDYNSNGNTLF